MNDVRGGFTEFDHYQGYRGSCRCGWVGPWRGWSLSEVEADVMAHWSECSERSFGGGTVGPTYTSGPGDAQTSRDPADRWRVDMVNDTSAVNASANGGDR